jgi:DNA modification methylase
LIGGNIMVCPNCNGSNNKTIKALSVGNVISPYYETKLGKLYHCDCLEIMPDLEPVTLALVDPPYGIGASTANFFRNGSQTGKSLAPSGANYKHYDWDNEPPSQEYFNLLFDISANQIIFGGNYFINFLKATSCFLVWDKDNGNNSYADCEIAWTSFKTATRLIKWRWHGFLKEAPETRYHPTQKPVGLFAWIIDKYSKPNDTILDTHLGSGTTAIACERLNRRWIGIEREEEYCEIAAKRINNETMQLKLF